MVGVEHLFACEPTLVLLIARRARPSEPRNGGVAAAPV
jgi:hypothetical protein